MSVRIYLCIDCGHQFSRVICNDVDVRRKIVCPSCGACGDGKIDRVYTKRSLTIGRVGK